MKPCPLSPEEVDQLYAKLGLKTSAARAFLVQVLQNTIMFDGKQQDYGSRNISSFGTYGVVVRMNDKFERIANLFKKQRRRPVNESIRDTFLDVANYGVIAYLVETNQWPSE